jgi:hypothetical protein
VTYNQDCSMDAATPRQVERDIILGLIYLEREARVARLMHLAKTIKSSMSDYLSNRSEADANMRTEQ